MKTSAKQLFGTIIAVICGLTEFRDQVSFGFGVSISGFVAKSRSFLLHARSILGLGNVKVAGC